MVTRVISLSREAEYVAAPDCQSLFLWQALFYCRHIFRKVHCIGQDNMHMEGTLGSGTKVVID